MCHYQYTQVVIWHPAISVRNIGTHCVQIIIFKIVKNYKYLILLTQQLLASL